MKKLLFIIGILLASVGYSQNTVTVGSSGSEHTFIDQDVTMTSSPTFVLATLDTVVQNGEITIGGCFIVADDATILLPDASTQSLTVYVDGDNEYALVAVRADGTVTLMASEGSTVNTDTDTNLCVFDSGTGATIRNRLGAEKTICYQTKYRQ